MKIAFPLLLILSMMAVSLSTARQHQLMSSDITETIEKDNAGSNMTSDITETIEKANAESRTALVHGDIMPSAAKNAVPCTAWGCKWPKYSRFVYVPVTISRAYSTTERNTIIGALLTFHRSTCIRFVWRAQRHRNYIYFYPGSGCFSKLGRQTRGQFISLSRSGCVTQGIVQHEVLHALGFHHEQVRSDRDRHVIIQYQNIIRGKESNFRRIRTNNLWTPYDFRSIMQYSKYAFSKNGRPTIVARSNPNLIFGTSTAMNQNDITRVNRLYKC